MFSKVLYLADKHKDEEHLYYPLQLDFRSRVYCVPAFLNYQSVGGAKALLEFANGKAITKENKGDFWLAIHGANMWGEDKCSLADRVKWVEENEEWIVACGKDPIANLQWTDADEAYQFLLSAMSGIDTNKQGMDLFLIYLYLSMAVAMVYSSTR